MILHQQCNDPMSIFEKTSLKVDFHIQFTLNGKGFSVRAVRFPHKYLGWGVDPILIAYMNEMEGSQYMSTDVQTIGRY